MASRRRAVLESKAGEVKSMMMMMGRELGTFGFLSKFALQALSICLVLASAAIVTHAQSGNLKIYWVDTEGGAATLIVTPSGQSLLADSGNPGAEDRDAKRIFEAARAAGLKKIDFLLTTHFHSDHVGGAPALARLIPIEKFYDHGDSIETADPRAAQLWEAYKTVSLGKRVILKPGDKIPIRGVDVRVVSSDGEVIGTINGSPNPLCKDALRKEPDKTENARSLGFVLTYGKFRFLDLGDLTWDKEMLLACPTNKVGKVTLFQATHHGFYNDASGSPALVWAIQPQVVVVNNGATKGLAANAYETLSKIRGLEAIWQSHRSIRNDAAHNTSESMIANLGQTPAECKGQWLEASISRDGKFKLTNSRNDFSKTYTAR
ncbi:MAG TPA: MBL fold metallo-hydrolase [Blastocatellia bacterium]|nr:MBL fold metallo-hydrolase [Blastocatellia bacterium]